MRGGGEGQGPSPTLWGGLRGGGGLKPPAPCQAGPPHQVQFQACPFSVLVLTNWPEVLGPLEVARVVGLDWGPVFLTSLLKSTFTFCVSELCSITLLLEHQWFRNSVFALSSIEVLPMEFSMSLLMLLFHKTSNLSVNALVTLFIKYFFS